MQAILDNFCSVHERTYYDQIEKKPSFEGKIKELVRE